MAIRSDTRRRVGTTAASCSAQTGECEQSAESFRRNFKGGA